ncbi:MAG: PIN domain-containing protein [Verrucomicrobia bacterium]|nr:PIN domain-containing protein [Verrucomicrobiota bacterium]MDA1085987.1 PIN domain-containing protein [Verrucomicrobiota bacterium]
MPADLFIDSNILVYAHDRDAGTKHEKAKQRLEEAWQGAEPASISVQVLQEFFINLARLGVPVAEARSAARDYASWRVVENTVSLMESGIDEMARWQTSFWDGLIIAAARHAGATTLWTEDLNEGQDYGGLRVVNPLR